MKKLTGIIMIRLVVIAFMLSIFGWANSYGEENETDTTQTDTLEFTMGAVTVTAPRYQKRIIDIPFSVSYLNFENSIFAILVETGIPLWQSRCAYFNPGIRKSFKLGYSGSKDFVGWNTRI